MFRNLKLRCPTTAPETSGGSERRSSHSSQSRNAPAAQLYARFILPAHPHLRGRLLLLLHRPPHLPTPRVVRGGGGGRRARGAHTKVLCRDPARGAARAARLGVRAISTPVVAAFTPARDARGRLHPADGRLPNTTRRRQQLLHTGTNSHRTVARRHPLLGRHRPHVPYDDAAKGAARRDLGRHRQAYPRPHLPAEHLCARRARGRAARVLRLSRGAERDVSSWRL